MIEEKIEEKGEEIEYLFIYHLNYKFLVINIYTNIHIMAWKVQMTWNNHLVDEQY